MDGWVVGLLGGLLGGAGSFAQQRGHLRLRSTVVSYQRLGTECNTRVLQLQKSCIHWTDCKFCDRAAARLVGFVVALPTFGDMVVIKG